MLHSCPVTRLHEVMSYFCAVFPSGAIVGTTVAGIALAVGPRNWQLLLRTDVVLVVRGNKHRSASHHGRSLVFYLDFCHSSPSAGFER